MESLHFRAMNTEVYLGGEGSSSSHLQLAFEQARRFILESEQRFTRFSPESELSCLNRAAGTWFHASPDMTMVVLLACELSRQTAGLFDPSILSALQRVGFDRSMDRLLLDEASPAPLLVPLPVRIPLEQVQVHPEESLILLPAGMSLDLGGIAKGWIAEQAAVLLADTATGCMVNAGGDLFLIGQPEDQEAWEIGIEDPRAPGRMLTVLQVRSGAVATSSIAKRTWKQGRLQRHHLIDPRTGQPAVTDWLSVTVTAPHADTAEVFAKALLIAGPGGAQEIAGQAPEITFLAADRQGLLWGVEPCLEGRG
jgi:thiamine biosynthesis lipoprotein